MDPNQCLDDILEAVFHDMDYELAYQYSEDLREWMSKGGATPDFTRARCEGSLDCIFQLLAEVVG